MSNECKGITEGTAR